ANRKEDGEDDGQEGHGEEDREEGRAQADGQDDREEDRQEGSYQEDRCQEDRQEGGDQASSREEDRQEGGDQAPGRQEGRQGTGSEEGHGQEADPSRHQEAAGSDRDAGNPGTDDLSHPIPQHCSQPFPAAQAGEGFFIGARRLRSGLDPGCGVRGWNAAMTQRGAAVASAALLPGALRPFSAYQACWLKSMSSQAVALDGIPTARSIIVGSRPVGTELSPFHSTAMPRSWSGSIAIMPR